jgi:UDP-galactose transporter B1
VLVDPNAPLGYLLCFVNLAFDGYTNAAQDEINHHHPKNAPLHMMCWMNFWTALYYLAYIFGFTSQGSTLLSFCLAHGDAAWDTALFCICGAVGQLFIFFTIKTFSSLVRGAWCWAVAAVTCSGGDGLWLATRWCAGCGYGGCALACAERRAPSA